MFNEESVIAYKVFWNYQSKLFSPCYSPCRMGMVLTKDGKSARDYSDEGYVEGKLYETTCDEGFHAFKNLADAKAWTDSDDIVRKVKLTGTIVIGTQNLNSGERDCFAASQMTILPKETNWNKIQHALRRHWRL
jgi:hypothetical protein